MGHLTWEPCGILHQGHLYFTWKLETFTCKPSPANLPLGTLWEPVPEACQPLVWNLYICFWLRTLTWKPCGNQDCVTWEPCRNRFFWGEPLLGKSVGICIQGNIENVERQTLSETVHGNIGRLGNLAGTFLWKPLLGDLYLGTFWSIIPRCSPFSPSSSSLRCTQVKSNPTVTKSPPSTPCQKQYLKPWEQRGNFHLKSTWDCLVNLCLGTLGGNGFWSCSGLQFWEPWGLCRNLHLET